MKQLQFISRLIIGVTFIFSGFVKAIDPLGSAYKFSDYFTAFNLDFLQPFTLVFAILLSSFEFVLGLVILLGYLKRGSYWLLFIFMSFFTLLTFFLALFNPVSDCGCFGDALIMTNWETFFKNLVIMVFVIILFGSRRKEKSVHHKNLERTLVLLFFAGVVYLSVYSYFHLPIIDFRPYDIGTYIPDEMKIPEDAPVDEYKTTLIYRNKITDKESRFSVNDYPKDTTVWAFVKSESELISKGYEPPIHDFVVTDQNGNDRTDHILGSRNYSLLVISHDLNRADSACLARLNSWVKLDRFAEDLKVYPITSTTTAEIENIKERWELNYDFFMADEIMLKTVIRSNPGFVLIKNGTIVGKWAKQDFPELHHWNPDWSELVDQDPAGHDPEMTMLLDSGDMEQPNWNIILFDKSATRTVLNESHNQIEQKNWIIFIISMLFIISVLQLIPKRKRHHRV